jgi:hypothetical protein
MTTHLTGVCYILLQIFLACAIAMVIISIQKVPVTDVTKRLSNNG